MMFVGILAFSTENKLKKLPALTISLFLNTTGVMHAIYYYYFFFTSFIHWYTIILQVDVESMSANSCEVTSSFIWCFCAPDEVKSKCLASSLLAVFGPYQLMPAAAKDEGERAL